MTIDETFFSLHFSLHFIFFAFHHKKQKRNFIKQVYLNKAVFFDVLFQYILMLTAVHHFRRQKKTG